MKVTFLGTSHGRPDFGKHCTSMMVEVNDAIYLVDAGAPVTDCMYFLGKDFSKLKGIFITHVHADHLDGIVFLLDIVANREVNTKFKVVVSDKKLHKILIDYVELVRKKPFPLDRIEFVEPTIGEVFKDENISVEYFETKHIPGEDCYGMVIKGNGKTAVFSGDMSGGLAAKDFPKYALENETDLVVSEMAHFEMTDLEPYIAKLNTKMLYINHLNRAYKYDDVKKVAESKKYLFPIIAANDNDVVEL